MNKLPFKRFAGAVACAAILTACGGGLDDEAGAPSGLSVTPAGLTVQAAAGSNCPGIADPATGTAQVVKLFYINGGSAPYRIDSSDPTRVGVTTNLLGDRGQAFGVYLLGGCVKPSTIVIRDRLNVVISVEINYTDS